MLVPTAAEIRDQTSSELPRRTRLAVPSLAGGVLYLLGTIILASTSNNAPKVGLLQGLAPALSGVANPRVSPRAAEVKYISHHAFGVIAGSVLTALALGALTLVLLLLLDATRFRRPQTFPAARPLVLFGGAVLTIVTVAHQVVGAIEAHNFAVGHDLSNQAVDRVTTNATAIVALGSLGLIAWVALAAGMIATMINGLRVGLLPRWLSILGMFTAMLIFLPLGATLELIPAFWMVATGILLAGRWPNGDPPAWAAGEARPWPTPAERRAEREEDPAARGRRGGQPRTAQPAVSGAGTDLASAPPPGVSAGKRRRKRGRRG
jgi:hypothetical protein